MPVNETPNTITVGRICMFCVLFATGECPYKNHEKRYITMFTGDIRGKCIFYEPITEAKSDKNMGKTAKDMNDFELNKSLFRKISVLCQKDRDKLFGYWNYLFPENYAEDMVTDDNETKQKGISEKGVKPSDLNKKKKKKDKDKGKTNKFPETFKV